MDKSQSSERLQYQSNVSYLTEGMCDIAVLTICSK